MIAELLTEKKYAAEKESSNSPTNVESKKMLCGASFRCGGWQEYRMSDVTYAECQLEPHSAGKHYFAGERQYWRRYDEVNDKIGELITQKYEVFWEIDENELENKYEGILRG